LKGLFPEGTWNTTDKRGITEPSGFSGRSRIALMVCALLAEGKVIFAMWGKYKKGIDTEPVANSDKLEMPAKKIF
jgi:hypothetical protein